MEWLNERAANAAIAFFRAGADLLPTEPHIYAIHTPEISSPNLKRHSWQHDKCRFR